MCPVCLASIAMVAAAVTSGGAATALVAVKLRNRKRRAKTQVAGENP